jgi:phytanoyl-CoA hydroxylase
MPRLNPAGTVYRGMTDHVTPAHEAERIRRTLYRTDAASRARVLPQYQERLAASDLAQYAAEGYLAMEGVLTPDDVAAAIAALGEIVHGRTSSGGKLFIQAEPFFQQGGAGARADDPEHRIRKVAAFCAADARLGRVATHPRLMPLLDQLLGPEARMIQDMALLKPPFVGSEKPWHQDAAYFDWAPLEGVLGVWLALDPATVDNGCMQIIPGSHLAGPVPHHHARDCQIPDSRVEVERAQVVPLAPGGALIFSALLHHGTPPNHMPDRRRALQFHYAAAACRQVSFTEHARPFSANGGYAGCRDWDMPAGLSRAVVEP